MEEGGHPLVPSAGAGAPGPPPLPSGAPIDRFDINRDREETRHLFGLILLGLFVLTVLGSLVALFVGVVTGNRLRNILAVVIPPEVSLLGAVLGFYYGTKVGGGPSS